jgi:NDP-sugar pyrophosphorylase family protein
MTPRGRLASSALAGNRRRFSAAGHSDVPKTKKGRKTTMANGFTPADFWDLSKTNHAGLYDGCEYAWEALKRISDYVKEKLKEVGAEGKTVNKGKLMGSPYIDTNVFIDEGTVVEHGAMIKGPAFIGKNCEIRNGAYIRGNVLVDDGTVIGNSCEVKNAAFHQKGNVPHFAYVGDSILGFKAHFGAGVKVSNVKLTWETVKVKIGEGNIVDTGLKKFGAIVGDEVDVGCNATLNPGSLIFSRSIVYPLSSFRGILRAKQIHKSRITSEVVQREER